MHKRHSKAKYTAGKVVSWLHLPQFANYTYLCCHSENTFFNNNHYQQRLIHNSKNKKQKISSTVKSFLMIFTKLIVKLNILNEHLIFWKTCHFAVLYWDIALIRRYRSFSVCNFLNCSLIVLRIRTTVSNFQTSGQIPKFQYLLIEKTYLI